MHHCKKISIHTSPATHPTCQLTGNTASHILFVVFYCTVFDCFLKDSSSSNCLDIFIQVI